MSKLIAIGILFCLSSLNVNSQNTKSDSGQINGVAFEKNATWQEILQKATAENKYIFVDCYASWCEPCKWMDQHVYSKDTVEMIISKRFLSIRVQMDTAINDNEETRKRYGMAHNLNQQYDIHIYPSLLFFSPDGRLVHKGVGAMDIYHFLALADEAVNPQTQFYTVLQQYRLGMKDDFSMMWLAKHAREIREDSISSFVARDYLNNDLVFQPLEKIWTKENLNFISSFKELLHPEDSLFSRYFADRNFIDSVLEKPGKSDKIINAVIYQNEVRPKVQYGIKTSVEPNWRQIEKTIGSRYGERYVTNNVLDGRVEYYRTQKKWSEYSKYLVKRVELGDIKNWDWNNMAFEIFQYSFDKIELEKALTWVDRWLSMNAKDPEALDTKANLLYKLGRKGEALAIEQKSIELAPEEKEIIDNYTKMKTGLPTWKVFNTK